MISTPRTLRRLSLCRVSEQLVRTPRRLLDPSSGSSAATTHPRAPGTSFRGLGFSLVLLAGILGAARSAHAEVALGGHLGLNLDRGHIHLGADLLVPLSQLSPSVRVDLRPSLANVFVDGGNDVRLFGLDFPFEFDLANSIVTPYAAPGLGLAVANDVWLKLNLIGGCFFDVGDGVRLWSELAIRLVNGTSVDLLAGVLFEL